MPGPNRFESSGFTPNSSETTIRYEGFSATGKIVQDGREWTVFVPENSHPEDTHPWASQHSSTLRTRNASNRPADPAETERPMTEKERRRAESAAATAISRAQRSINASMFEPRHGTYVADALRSRQPQRRRR